MYSKILVPLDGSPLGERAMPLAETLAQALDAKIILTQAVHTPGLPTGVLNAAQIRLMDEAEAYLNKVAEPLREEGLMVEVGVPFAAADDGILDEIDLRKADLVVMTTHGRSGFNRWIYGSVAEAVLARSPAPVLLVRANEEIPPHVLDHPEPQILVPLDGSVFAEAALPHAVAMAKALNAQIMLICVHEPPPVTASDIMTHPERIERVFDKEQHEVEAYLMAVTEQVRSEGVTAHPLLRAGAVAQTILEECWAQGISLVVMATHGRTGLGQMLFGSVAMEVLKKGTLPVLLVRPHGLGATQSLSREKEHTPAH